MNLMNLSVGTYTQTEILAIIQSRSNMFRFVLYITGTLNNGSMSSINVLILESVCEKTRYFSPFPINSFDLRRSIF